MMAQPEDTPSTLHERLRKLFCASRLESAVIRRSRTLALLAFLAFFLDISRFITSMFQAKSVLKYVYGVVEVVFAGGLFSLALHGALSKDGRYTGVYAVGGFFMNIYQAVQIVFGVFAVRTLEEELPRVQQTNADPRELQIQVALYILHVLLNAAGCVAYCCSSVAALLLREQILKSASAHIDYQHADEREQR